MSSTVNPTKLTCSGASFPASGLVGKFIRVVGAGTAGADLVTTIAARDSATVLTLNDSAATTVSGKHVFYGTDNTAAFTAAIDAAKASTTTKTIFIPVGKYLCNIEGASDVSIVGGGGYSGQTAYTPASFAARTDKTFLLPALATKAVIYYRTIGADLKGAGNPTIADIVFLAGNGTSAIDRRGIGLEYAESLNTSGSSAGVVAARTIRCEFNGFRTGMTFSRSWGNIIDQCIVNYCETGFLLGGFDGSGNYAVYGGNDGIMFNTCSSTYVDVVFRIYGSKQMTIANGDYNHMEKFCYMDNSKVFITGVNLEYTDQGVVDQRCFLHLGNAYGPSYVEVSQVFGLGVTAKIFNERTDGHYVSVDFGLPLDYYTTMDTGYPQDLPPGSKIIRCTNSTWATTKRVEEWNHLRINHDNLQHPSLVEEFIKGGASPYGSLAWVMTNISGSTAVATVAGLGLSLYQDVASETCRFMPEAEMTNFATNWRMRFRFDYAFNVASTVTRIGLYSRDGTAAMIPANGIGMRLDTVTAADTTVKLEVIVGGVIQTVVDTGFAISSMGPVSDLVIEKRGGTVRMIVLNASGTARFNQVVYTGTMPSSAAYASPGVFLSGSVAQQLNVRRMLFNVFE
jgi:hypothetical protein